MGDADSLGTEVWRGGVNTWETDEMGHMNVRFYLTRAAEGLAGLAAALGMPRAFAAEAAATLLLREHHIRFLREAYAGGLLHMRAGVLSMGETEAEALLVLYHSATGEPAASFIARLSHVTADERRPFPWPQKARERAAALAVVLPDYAAPRSLPLTPFETRASLARAEALGVRRIALGAIGPQDCDVFGRLRADQVIGRVADGIPQLVSDIRATVAEHAEPPPKRTGGAVLEYRLAYLDWPRAGDRIAVHSGLVGMEGSVQRLAHWILDPESGKPWATSMAVAATLDLDARKIVPVSPAARERLNARAIPALTL
jgi:acyl-CoA thioester hydrolase